MDLKPNFSFRPLPEIDRSLQFALSVRNRPLGPLQNLPGTWQGTGFNVIWRPHHATRQDRFLELNLTTETLQFERIPGKIPNRGFLQHDIFMFGVSYLQQITDANNQAGLHIEPGVWATVPKTINPAEPATVVRMASIPHGTTVLAQGVAKSFNRAPTIAHTDITPFVIGHPNRKKPFPESDLSVPSAFRLCDPGVTQTMVDNPNSILTAALSGQQVKKTVALAVSSRPTAPILGGGVANTAFLQGGSAGPNARAALVEAIFWIERVRPSGGSRDFYQLQYTQRVLLNFNGLSWPHISVATLRKR